MSEVSASKVSAAEVSAAGTVSAFSVETDAVGDDALFADGLPLAVSADCGDSCVFMYLSAITGAALTRYGVAAMVTIDIARKI